MSLQLFLIRRADPGIFPEGGGWGYPIKSKVFDPLRSRRDMYTGLIYVHGPSMREAERIRVKTLDLVRLGIYF